MFGKANVLLAILPLATILIQATTTSTNNFFVESLFPGVPPVIRFSNPDFQTFPPVNQIPDYLKPYLHWSPTNDRTKRFREFYNAIINATGIPIFPKERKSCCWFGKLGKSSFSSSRRMKSVNPIVTQPYQKYNHIPRSLELGNKVKMGEHLATAVTKLGRRNFQFVLESYGLPSQMNDLKSALKRREDLGQDNTWIAKPAMKSKSKGVFLINEVNWKQLDELRSSYLVQKYLATPFLTATGRTVQFRTVVLVTSVLPLRVYISYESEATVGQSVFNMTKAPDSVSDKTALCGLIYAYGLMSTCNADESETFVYLPNFLRQQFDIAVISKIKNRIQDSVIKTLTTVLPDWEKAARLHYFNRYNGYQLFSFDFLLDKNHRPWLHEINTHQSFYNITAGNQYDPFAMIVSSLNIAGFHLPPILPYNAREVLCEHEKDVNRNRCLNSIVFNASLYSFEKNKVTLQGDFNWHNLTDDSLKLLVLAEDELHRCHFAGNFNRIFPSTKMKQYLQYLQSNLLNRGYTKLMIAWEEQFGGGNRSRGIRLLKNLVQRWQ